jgi:hypothetical protein
VTSQWFWVRLAKTETTDMYIYRCHVLKLVVGLILIFQPMTDCDILGVRNPKAGNDVISKIRKSGVSSGKALVLPLDLTSLKSVRNFASDVLDRTDRVDLLINNGVDLSHNYFAHILKTATCF